MSNLTIESIGSVGVITYTSGLMQSNVKWIGDRSVITINGKCSRRNVKSLLKLACREMRND